MARHTITHAEEYGLGNGLFPGRGGESQRGVTMLFPNVRNLGQVAAIDADGIATSQTPAAGGQQDLTLDGAFVTDGVATLTPTGRNISITAAANETARTFTIIGFDINGNPQIEELAGPNATIGEGNKDWSRVTRIFVDDDTAGAVEVGDGSVVAVELRNGFGDQDDDGYGFLLQDGIGPIAPAGSSIKLQHVAPTATSAPDRITFDLSDANWGLGSKYVVFYSGDMTKEGTGRTYNG